MTREPTHVVPASAAPEEQESDANAPATLGPAEASNLLAPYFRDLAGAPVMTKDEEVEAAGRIAELRRGFWRAILSYPPFIDGICDLAAEVLTPLEMPERVARLEQLRHDTLPPRLLEAAQA